MTPDEVMNTPAGLLDKMMTAENIYKSFQEFDSLRADMVSNWIDNNPDKWDLVVKTNGW